jgi:hypothetical protein
VTQKEIVEASRSYKWSNTSFTKRNFTSTEIERFFKGEKWGTKTIYVTYEKVRKPAGISSVINQAKKAIRAAEGEAKVPEMKQKYAEVFINKMLKGPQWCRDIIMEFDRNAKNLTKILQKVLQIIEKSSEKNLAKTDIKKSTR